MSAEKKNKIRIRKRAIETEIVEDQKVLSAYGYCELPSHFFDRALAQQDSEKGANLLVERWRINTDRR